MKTTVIFRKDSHGVFAIFPYEIADYRMNVTWYAHIGQHSAGDYHCMVTNSKPANENEYNSLKRELEGIGYDLEVRQKYTQRKFERAVLEFSQRHLQTTRAKLPK